MRGSFSKPPVDFMVKFFFTQPVFSVGLILCGVLFLVTIALAISGVNETWEKRCGRMLFFTLVPVYMWIANFFFPEFPPLHATIALWVVFLFFFTLRRLKSRIREDKAVSSADSWRCPKCKTINERVYIACKKCRHPHKKNEP